MRYNLVIFDVDGTLLDTSEGITDSVCYAISAMHLKPLTVTEVHSKFIGPPIQNTFKRVYDLSDTESNKAADIFREHYRKFGLTKAVPYIGIFELCRDLVNDGIKIAIATYKRQDYAEIIIKHFGFDAFTDVIAGGDFTGKLAKKDIISNAVNTSGIKSLQSVVMIGDTHFDAEGALGLGIDFIAVTYGFGYRRNSKKLCGNNIIGYADTVNEIYQILKER